MKKVYFILVLCLASLSAGRAGEEAPSSAAARDTAAANQDSIELAITILLPELEAKASNVDSVADRRDLYRTMTVARGYQELGLFEKAGEWYQRLSDLDSNGLFADAIFNGLLSVAAGQGDLDSLNILLSAKRGEVEEPNSELIVELLQQFGNGGHWDRVESLIANCSNEYFGAKPPAGILLLKGRALRRQGRLAEAIFHYEALLNALKVPSSVHSSLLEQKARLIQMAADCSFLMNDRLRARQLYRELMGEEDLVLQSWGRFQLAQLDMLSNSYGSAEQGFRTVAADSLGLYIEGWSETLAAYCADMKSYAKFYVSTGPWSVAVLP